MVIVAGRTSYFYCVSVQEGSGPCEAGESVGLKRNSDIVRNELRSVSTILRQLDDRI